MSKNVTRREGEQETSSSSGVAGAAAPQPVAWMRADDSHHRFMRVTAAKLFADDVPLYASPQARTAAPGVPASVAERERFEAWLDSPCEAHEDPTPWLNYTPSIKSMLWAAWQAAMAPPPPHFMGHGQPLPSLSGQPQWRPIESAPRDGRPVLLWAEDGEFTGHMIAIFYDGAWFTDEYRSCCEPTHWAPLPSPPPTYDTKGREETRSDDHDETKGDTGERT